MKQKLREFIENCLKIKVHDESATQIPLKGKWQQFNYYASFGKGAFAYVPWLGFFAFNQVVTKGIYPVILYNTKANNLNFEVCYGISATSAPDIYWNVKYTQNLQHSNTPKYTQSFVKKSYTINTIEDFEINADDIIQQINSILNDFNEQFSSNDSEEQLLESLILQYASFKNTTEYNEQYKWTFAAQSKGFLNNFDNIDKVAKFGSINFQSYFMRSSGMNYMVKYHKEKTVTAFKALFDLNKNLQNRISNFINIIKSACEHDGGWRHKGLANPGVETASFYLYAQDYTKYLLFTKITPFETYAKKFNLLTLLNYNTPEERYEKWQNYCINELIPIMNDVLSTNCTLLDAQDFIWYIGNSDSCASLRNDLLEYYQNLNLTIDDTPNDYTAIKNENNIAEVHRINSKNTKFRVIINYDKLPENMRENCKRVPDSYGWTLNGECWVTSRDSLDDVIRKIDSTLDYLIEDNYENHKEIDKMNIPLNQILYGPPGTGKTYNTVLKAMSIIDNAEYKDVPEEQYSALKTRFDELKQAGQIEFVTFHQSYSYEEFVEGIKPDLSSDDLKYMLEDGIFKNICEHAEVKFSDNFDEIYGKFLDEISSSEGLFKLKTRKYKKEFGLEINSNNNLNIYMGNDFHKQGTLTKENIQRHFLQTRTQSDWSGYYDGIIDYLQDKYHLKKQDKKIQPHILIIDEINRGDISKIFGELITLIEEDKRIGNKYQMKITLPYSKESFGVPNNLYIIGTMNTADRSIALLDTALRRRFDFEEIMPRPKLLNNKIIEGININLQTLLTRINERITNKYDRDHQIGHSYLMGVNTKEQLERAYKNRILPLLNEYFYNESKTVAEILNCSEDELKTSDFISILGKAQGA